jgi:AcrR family transcriptional regulator
VVHEYHNGFRVPRQVILSGGRRAQKDRTRRDILASARSQLDAGLVPTVAEAADRAGVSRTTAYRYFPTQDVLLAEAGIEPLIDKVDEAIAAAEKFADPIARVDTAFASIVPALLAREAQLRAMLKTALGRSLREDFVSFSVLQSEPWVVSWDPLLEPLRKGLSPRRYALLTRALAVLLGIQSLIAIKDSCDGDDKRTIAALRELARSLVRGFLAR